MLRGLLSLLLALAVCDAASAQAWPERAVRLVVPFPAGGNVDVTGRIVAEHVQKIIGQPVVIENRAGAGGIVGIEHVAKATPDGYTLVLTVHGPLLFVTEYTGRKPYEWRKDFVAITPLSLTPLVVQVHPGVPAKNIDELARHARANPGMIRMATPGVGSLNHLLGEMMQLKLGLKFTTVHYRGNAPAMNDLVGGHVHLGVDQASFAAPFIQQGQSRGLAVTSAKRVSSLPDVPTFAELGHPDLDAQTFVGLMAPAATPTAVVERIHASFVKALAEPSVSKRLEGLGAFPSPMTPAAFRTYLEKEDKTWLPLVRQLGIKTE